MRVLIAGLIDLSRHMTDAILTLQICLAADQSIRSGRVVKLD